MTKFPRNFCVAPFLQCTTHPSGSFSPCPYLGGTTWKSAAPDIRSRWTSPDLQHLRENFLQDLQDPICRRCWHEEANGKKSLRLRLFDPENHTSDFGIFNQEITPQQIMSRIESREYLLGPEILTIKNGNVCNARCRVCHPGDSSRWIRDAQRLHDITGKMHYAISVEESNWSDQQLQEILDMAPSLRRLELFGGEPLFNRQVHRLLQDLVALGHCEHITLYINTNGSVDITERVPEIRHFHTVEIGVSIDGVGPHFDYIRNGLDYQQVRSNVMRWQEYFSRHGTRYFIDSISTVEILNVFYLPELKSAVKEFLPLAPFWNLLIEPAYLFIKNMPDGPKSRVIEKLAPDPDFADIISVIQQPADPTQWPRFLEITRALDEIRDENFAETFPEFHACIQERL